MKYLRLNGGILLLVFLFSSCVKEVSYYEEEIPQGSIVMKSQTPQRVCDCMILEILEITDSRCPIGVVCNSPGEVGVLFKVYVNNEFSEVFMSFDDVGTQDICSLIIEGHEIQITDVSPFLYLDDSIDPMDYRIELNVNEH